MNTKYPLSKMSKKMNIPIDGKEGVAKEKEGPEYNSGLIGPPYIIWLNVTRLVFKPII